MRNEQNLTDKHSKSQRKEYLGRIKSSFSKPEKRLSLIFVMLFEKIICFENFKLTNFRSKGKLMNPGFTSLLMKKFIKKCCDFIWREKIFFSQPFKTRIQKNLLGLAEFQSLVSLLRLADQSKICILQSRTEMLSALNLKLPSCYIVKMNKFSRRSLPFSNPEKTSLQNLHSRILPDYDSEVHLCKLNKLLSFPIPQKNWFETCN